VSRVVIVGAGLAGLTCAHRLRGRLGGDADVTLVEATDRVGGNLHTERIDRWLVEWGPNGFLDNSPPTLDLVHELGVDGELVPSRDAARRRFVFKNGRLRLLPGSPGAFLRSDILSTSAKLRLAAEPFAARRPEGDETIHAFASRRLGTEAADMLVDPMVSGIFAGDARQLSLRAAFPKIWELETEHGGLFRALLARRRKVRASGAPIGSPLGRLTSFRGGVETLSTALAAALGDCVRTRTRVASLARTSSGRWSIATASNTAIEATELVLATPPAVTASLVHTLDGELAATLRAIPSAPLAVVAFGFDGASVQHPLDGFGFLVPRGQGPRILGALWESSIYPGRAVGNETLIRVMAGGAHDPGLVDYDDDQIVGLVRLDLRTTMGLTAEPRMVRIIRHRDGIPQYTVGHLERLASIDAGVARLPGLHLSGHGYHGVGINHVIAQARALADRIADARPLDR
jgi:oxygen-dependent protoporphyrinogen oxidase